MAEVEVIKVDRLAVKRTTAADLLDCSPSTIYKLERAGILKTVQVGTDRRITMESLRRYAAGGSTA